MTANSKMVSREGGEQYLVVEHDGEEYEAVLRTIHRETESGDVEEVDEYMIEADEDEEIPTAVEEEVTAQNQALYERGADEGNSQPTQETDGNSQSMSGEFSEADVDESAE